MSKRLKLGYAVMEAGLLRSSDTMSALNRGGRQARIDRRVFACAAFAAAAWLYCALFVLPSTPFIRTTWAYDQWVNLEGGMRMLAGQRIYIDFFQYTLPGTEVLYLLLFKIWGVRAWIPNVVLLAAAVACFSIGIAMSRRVLSGWSVYLPGAFFLSILLAVPDATHHKLSIVMVLAAMAVLVEQRDTPRLVIAGLLLGVATCFTQSTGFTAAVFLGGFLGWENRRAGEGTSALLFKEALLIVPYAAIVAAVSAYLVAELGLVKFIQLIVLFPLKYYPADARYNTWRVLWYQPMPSLTNLSDLPMVLLYGFVYLLPVCYAILLHRYRRRNRDARAVPWNTLMLLATEGLSLLASVWYSPSFGRLSEVSLPSLVLFVWLLGTTETYSRRLLQIAWSAAIALLIVAPAEAQFGWRGVIDGPAGTVAFDAPEVYQTYRWLLAHTHPGDTFFESGDMDDIYFLMHLQNPTEVPYLTANDYTRPEQVRDAIRNLDDNKVKYVLWDTDLDHPISSDAPTDHLTPLRDYLHGHYQLVISFYCQFVGKCQVLERNDLPPNGPASGGEPPRPAWRDKLATRINSTLDSGGGVFVAAHFFDLAPYRSSPAPTTPSQPWYEYNSRRTRASVSRKK